MNPVSRRAALTMLACLVAGRTAAAAPVPYILDPTASRVGFRFTLAGTVQSGTIPVRTADIVIDPQNLAASRVDVTVNAAGARAKLDFANSALLGPGILDVARFPTIRFVSDRVQLAPDGRLSGGARIAGQLTLRGVTRPMTLNASLFRSRGSAPDDLSTLTVALTGRINRFDHGANGNADLVGPMIDLDITAVIRAAR